MVVVVVVVVVVDVVVVEVVVGFVVVVVDVVVGFVAVGAGGLGDIAIRRGYQAYNITYLIVTSIILIVFVQVVQNIGNWLYKKLL